MPSESMSNPSSMEPSQLLSSPSQISAVGTPGVHVSTCTPAWHVNMPVLTHSPIPQFVSSPYQDSSVPSSASEESQSLSRPSHNSAAGVPGVQVSTSVPSMHSIIPAATHSPTSQLVGVSTYSSSVIPSQSSSMPLQAESSAMGFIGSQASPILLPLQSA